jgi:hypothetical protein
MEARLLGVGVGGYSIGELHEHGDCKRMMESKKRVLRLVAKVRR